MQTLFVNPPQPCRYTPLSDRFRRMAWISRTVFASETDEDAVAEEEPEDVVEPKKEKKFLAASSAYELLKLFYI